MQTRRLPVYSKGLNSSLAQLAGKLQRCKVMQKSGSCEIWKCKCIVHWHGMC